MGPAETRNRSWKLVAVTVARGSEEEASSLLFELGTVGIVTLEETSREVKLGAYFDASEESGGLIQRVEAGLARAGLSEMIFAVSVTEIADQDWMQKWKEGFAPVRVGERLVIAPSWRRAEVDDSAIVIEIDPGMAFGTGTHETTRMCLEAIERCWRGGSLLDVGTGTGILAIAAARLAPGSRVTAIDIDPQAVEVARQNAEINRVSSLIEVVEGGPGDFAEHNFDLVVANLTAEVIIDIVGDLTRSLGERGTLILSGILTELRMDVERSVDKSGLKIMDRREMGEWSLLVARKGEV